MRVKAGAMLAGLSTIAFLLPPVGGAAAQSVEEFYRGKTITILLGHPPGGSYDMYARLAANHMGKHIPGNPRFLIQAKPGGSGIVGLVALYQQGARDGSMMGIPPETAAHTQILSPNKAKWKMEEMHYVGSFANVNGSLVRRKDSPAKTLAEFKTETVNVGCGGKLGQSYITPALLKAYAGYKLNIICGYPGSAEIVIALERGEIDAYASSWNQWNRRAEIRDGTIVPMLQSGLSRHNDIPNVPLLQEIVDDPKQKKVIEFLSSGAAIGRALVTPPGVPADRLAALRAAFDKMVKDPEFLAEAEKVGAEINPTPGAEVQKINEEIVNAPKEIVDLAIEVTK